MEGIKHLDKLFSSNVICLNLWFSYLNELFLCLIVMQVSNRVKDFQVITRNLAEFRPI